MFWVFTSAYRRDRRSLSEACEQSVVELSDMNTKPVIPEVELAKIEAWAGRAFCHAKHLYVIRMFCNIH